MNRARRGTARRITTYTPMSSARVEIPVEVDGPSVQAVSELGTPSTSEPVWWQAIVDAAKAVVLDYLSTEVNADAMVHAVDTFVDSFARALAWNKGREFVVNLLAKLGAGGKATAASGHNSEAELDLANFANLIAKLPEQYADSSGRFIRSSGF